MGYPTLYLTCPYSCPLLLHVLCVYEYVYVCVCCKEFIKADVCRRLLSRATLLSVMDRHRHDPDFLAKFRRLYGSAENGNLTFLRDSIQNPTVREGCAGILSGMKSRWPLFDCVNHEQDINQKPNCV